MFTFALLIIKKKSQATSLKWEGKVINPEAGSHGTKLSFVCPFMHCVNKEWESALARHLPGSGAIVGSKTDESPL